MNIFKNIDSVIFDLDGTLLDSMFIWESLGYDYLTLKGCSPSKNINEKISSMSLSQSAEFFKKEYKLAISESEIVDEINLIIKNYYKKDFQLKEGVFKLLNQLKSENIKMCIASATDKKLISMALKRLNVFDFFCGIVTCFDVKAGKDDRLIFDVASKKLGKDFGDTSKTLVFEDALFAIKTATNAGYKVIGVYDETSKKDENEIKKIAYKYIKSFEDLYLY